MERLHVLIDGMVQAVGFRQFTMYQADRLGITGWVRNRRDRKVEVVAEGTHERLDELLGVLHEGPPAAVVRHVNSTWEPATGEFHTFDIR